MLCYVNEVGDTNDFESNAFYAWFPALHFHSSVTVSPLQKYVRKTFIRKNSVVYVKNNVLRFRKFVVSVHPFKQDIEFYFLRSVSTKPGAPPTRKCGKLAGQPQFDTPIRLYGAGTAMSFTTMAFTERQYGNGYG